LFLWPLGRSYPDLAVGKSQSISFSDRIPQGFQQRRLLVAGGFPGPPRQAIFAQRIVEIIDQSRASLPVTRTKSSPIGLVRRPRRFGGGGNHIDLKAVASLLVLALNAMSDQASARKDHGAGAGDVADQQSDKELRSAVAESLRACCRDAGVAEFRFVGAARRNLVRRLGLRQQSVTCRPCRPAVQALDAASTARQLYRRIPARLLAYRGHHLDKCLLSRGPLSRPWRRQLLDMAGRRPRRAAALEGIRTSGAKTIGGERNNRQHHRGRIELVAQSPADYRRNAAAAGRCPQRVLRSSRRGRPRARNRELPSRSAGRRHGLRRSHAPRGASLRRSRHRPTPPAGQVSTVTISSGRPLERDQRAAG